MLKYVYESGYFMRDLDPAASFQEAQNIIQIKIQILMLGW
jgi:hypothetical protein